MKRCLWRYGSMLMLASCLMNAVDGRPSAIGIREGKVMDQAEKQNVRLADVGMRRVRDVSDGP